MMSCVAVVTSKEFEEYGQSLCFGNLVEVRQAERRAITTVLSGPRWKVQLGEIIILSCCNVDDSIGPCERLVKGQSLLVELRPREFVVHQRLFIDDSLMQSCGECLRLQYEHAYAYPWSHP